MSEPDLYEHLRKECPSFDLAKAWIHRWANDWDQVLPWHEKPEFTLRSMAGHLSHVLEGGTYDNGYALGDMSYMSTRYGTKLYWAAVGIE